MALDPALSARISILRFVMIVGIVVLHVPPHVPLGEMADGVFPFIKAFTSEALFRATVPVLTCMSGFLLFHSASDQRFSELLYKKTHTLLLPFLLWNVPLVLTLYIAQASGFLTTLSTQLYPFDLVTALNETFGLFTEPVNYPLNFLRDLLVLMFLAPVIGVMLRAKPWVGLILVCLVFLPNLDGPLVLRDTMVVNFYLGGMAAILGWNMTRLDRYAPAFAVLLVAACTAIVILRIEDRSWFALVSPIIIWPISVLFIGTSLGDLCRRLAPHSFVIFLAHAPILFAIWLAYRTFPIVPYEVFWIAAPLITVMICLVGLHIMDRRHPIRAGVLGQQP